MAKIKRFFILQTPIPKLEKNGFETHFPEHCVNVGLGATVGQCDSSIILSFGFLVHLLGRNGSQAERGRIFLLTPWAMGYNPINNDVDTVGDTFRFSCVSFTSQRLSMICFSPSALQQLRNAGSVPGQIGFSGIL